MRPRLPPVGGRQGPARAPARHAADLGRPHVPPRRLPVERPELLRRRALPRARVAVGRLRVAGGGDGSGGASSHILGCTATIRRTLSMNSSCAVDTIIVIAEHLLPLLPGDRVFIRHRRRTDSTAAPAEEPTKVVRAKGVARARWNRDEEERLKKLVALGVLLRCLHFTDTTRVHLTSMRVVSFSSLGPFGPL